MALEENKAKIKIKKMTHLNGVIWREFNKGTVCKTVFRK